MQPDNPDSMNVRSDLLLCLENKTHWVVHLEEVVPFFVPDFKNSVNLSPFDQI